MTAISTRDEWDGMLKYIAAAKNSAFALKPGGTGNITESNIALAENGRPALRFLRHRLPRPSTCWLKTAASSLPTTPRPATSSTPSAPLAPGSYYASPVAADGNIYLASLADGAVTVLKAGAPQPEVVVQNPPLGERLSATPAIADNTLYIRTAGHLWAFAAP